MWQIDISQEDALISVGTEMGTIELYSFKVVERLQDQPKTQQAKASLPSNAITRSPSAAFIKCYQTKLNGVLVCKFSWMNFLTTIGCIEKVYN